ncbi:class III lanthionine synthetase LanKC N-terminal domain-containing protein [Helcococcus kunzii]|uniref:class III lanthionine synthetase LanKC N-terminal domain-containing protein n=1 Tax=Helcococcus kunzii TaxID=40091 RepID=UPI0038A54FE8
MSDYRKVYHKHCGNNKFYINKKYNGEEKLFEKIKNMFNWNNTYSIKKFPWRIIHFNENVSRKITAGWKIHISSTKENYMEVLYKSIKYLINNRIDFKFISSENGYLYINSKQISTVSSGKFITIYPREHEFLKVIEDLYYILEGYNGSYILTDQAYKDSKIVFYRFGEHYPINTINKFGNIENIILTYNGEFDKDIREPYYKEYDWTEKYNFEYDENEISNLINKYDIKEIISSGGAMTSFLGYNRINGDKCFIKEARQFSGLDDKNKYSQYRIRKEYEYLNNLSGKNYVPVVIDFIEEGGNSYLVEEFIEGQNLIQWLNLNNFLFKPYKTEEYIYQYIKRIDKILQNIVNIFIDLDKNDIYINDISPNNIIICDNDDVKIIDFEYAYSKNSDDIANVFTPGYDSKLYSHYREKELDKFRKIILFLFFPFTNMYDLNEDKFKEIILWFYKNYSKYLNNFIKKVLKMLIVNDLPEFLDYIIYDDNKIKFSFVNIRDKINNALIKTSFNEIINNASFEESNEYIFPSDVEVFYTNKFGLKVGALGVLWGLDYLSNSNQYLNNVQIKDFIRKSVNYCIAGIINNIYPQKGLDVGYYGMALALLELGKIDSAKYILNIANSLDYEYNNTMSYGNSGQLITNIKFYNVTKNKVYKDTSDLLGKHLINSLLPIEYTGIGEGNTGIALALFYYFLLTKDITLLEIIESKYKLDIDKFDYYNYYHNNFQFLNTKYEEKKLMFSPYVYDGTAGIGMLLVRLYIVTKKRDYYEELIRIIKFMDIEVTYMATYSKGLSGILDFLLDCLYVVEDYDVLDFLINLIKRVSNSIMLFYSKENKLFLGEQLFRLSTDLYSGSLGIIIVLKRYIRLIEEKILEPSFFFYLDKNFNIFSDKKIYFNF